MQDKLDFFIESTSIKENSLYNVDGINPLIINHSNKTISKCKELVNLNKESL